MDYSFCIESSPATTLMCFKNHSVADRLYVRCRCVKKPRPAPRLSSAKTATPSGTGPALEPVPRPPAETSTRVTRCRSPALDTLREHQRAHPDVRVHNLPR